MIEFRFVHKICPFLIPPYLHTKTTLIKEYEYGMLSPGYTSVYANHICIDFSCYMVHALM